MNKILDKRSAHFYVILFHQKINDIHKKKLISDIIDNSDV